MGDRSFGNLAVITTNTARLRKRYWGNAECIADVIDHFLVHETISGGSGVNEERGLVFSSLAEEDAWYDKRVFRKEIGRIRSAEGENSPIRILLNAV